MRTSYFRLALLFITGMILHSCNDTANFKTLSFDDIKEVSLGEVRQWEDAPDDQIIAAIYSQPGQYMVFMPMDSCKMHFYDRDMKYMYSRVVVGQGPGEFVSPLYCGQWEENDSSTIVTGIYDEIRGNILQISPRFNGAKEVASIPETLGLNPGFMVSAPQDNCIYGVSSFIGCQLGSGVMFKYDMKNDSLMYSLPSFSVNNREKAFHLMQKATAGSHDCKLFINAYLFEPVIEIWNSDMELVTSFRLKDVNMVDSEFEYENATYFFRGVEVREKYIYVMYYGRGYMRPGNSYLLVFDKSYSPVYKINIGDTHWFTVNEENNTIVLMRLNDERETTVYFATMPSDIL